MSKSVDQTDRNGRPTPDSQVKIFDARNLKTMSSFNFANGPSLKSTTLVLTANTGVVNVVDILKPDMSELYQVSVAVWAGSHLSANPFSWRHTPSSCPLRYRLLELILHSVTQRVQCTY